MMLYFALSFLAVVDAPVGIQKISANSTTLKNIFNVVLALAGAVAVGFIVWAGIQYIISQGEPAATKKAREAILYSLIGIVVVMLAFTIVNFVIGKF